MNPLTVTSRLRAGMSGKTLIEARFSTVGAKKEEDCCSGSMDTVQE